MIASPAVPSSSSSSDIVYESPASDVHRSVLEPGCIDLVTTVTLSATRYAE